MLMGLPLTVWTNRRKWEGNRDNGRTICSNLRVLRRNQPEEGARIKRVSLTSTSITSVD